MAWRASVRRFPLLRVGLGVSATAALASRNRIYSDGEVDPPEKPREEALNLMDDKFAWGNSIRYLGNQAPDGIARIFWCSRFATRIRILSQGPRTMLSLFEGDFVYHSNIADVVAHNIWTNVENLFKLYQTDLSTPQPVESIQEPHPPPETIRSVLSNAVSYADRFVIDYFLGRVFSTSTPRYAADAMRASASSCQLSALYDKDASLLHIVSLGNMRAILGRPRPPAEDGSVMYDVHVLSVDHSPNNPDERDRVQALHKDEELFEDGTFLGRPYTRALGDGRGKWTVKEQDRLHKDYLAPPPDPRVQTPPYVSADPDITSIKIESGDFLVMSSSWVSECLTNEEVVGLVGAWMKQHGENIHASFEDVKPDPAPGPALEAEDLPVKLKEDRTTFFRRWGVPKRFFNSEPNPTVHIAHNAMGGADANLRQALLEMAPVDSSGNTKSLAVAIMFFE
ncbi:PPM-type phosphatase domain-containing protein [Mycena kentingensis (nom. inval.)]|nr:PPM-type phosphatase domain-containing protein [Mycena kentingensis (nom. inval.)]